MNKLRQKPIDNFVTQVRLLDRKRNFDAPVKIARHPIGAGKKHLPLTGVLQIVNPAVLEKSAHNAEDADVFAQAGDFWPQAANASDDQINGHVCAGSFVEFLDNLLIDEVIEFCDDAARFPRERVIALALDLADQSFVEIERSDEQFFQTGITGQTGECVENDGHLFGQLRLTGKQAKVSVNASGARMVIASAQMNVM